MAVTIDTTAEINSVRLKEQAGDPSAPAASHWSLYTKAGGLYIKDSAGVVTGPFGTGSGGTWGTETLLNDTGGTVNAGDFVFIQDGGTASAFTTDPDALVTSMFPGIVEDASIANGASGLVRFFGIAPTSNLDATAAVGDRIAKSVNTLQGTPHTMPTGGNPLGFDAGDFGIALDTGTTPPVFLWGMPIQRGEKMLGRTTGSGVNLNTGTAQTLYNVPAGRTAIITRFVVRLASTSLTTVSFSIGWNAASYNDVLANATHTELTGNTLYSVLAAKAGAAIGAAGSDLKLLCNTLQGGAATAVIETYGMLY